MLVLAESDSKLVIDCIMGDVVGPWKLRFIFCEINSMKFKFASLYFKHVYHEANFTVDTSSLGLNFSHIVT